MGDVRYIFRALSVTLVGVAGSVTILIQQDQVEGIGWALGVIVLTALATFSGEIAGGIAGAVRAASGSLQALAFFERDAIQSKPELHWDEIETRRATERPASRPPAGHRRE